LIGCLIVVGLYLSANLAYIVTLPLDSIQNPEGGRLAGAFMRQIIGDAGTIVMAVAIMISTFGCNNGLIMSGARVSYAMARDGLFFAPLAKTNSKHVPAIALLVQGVWATILVLPRTVTTSPNGGAPIFGNVYTQLLEYIVSVDLVFGTLSVLAVIVLRFRAPQAQRPYRTWGYPVVPIVFLILSTFLIVNLAFLAPATSGIGYLIGLTGIPVYFIWRRHATTNGLLESDHIEAKP
jgi:APA family basic amino acid/polyamine antiporter